MSDRFNVGREVRRTLAGSAVQALEILPALAGELLASNDVVTIAELKDALSRCVLEQGPNHDIAEAVLAMVRTYTISQAPRFA